jgi:hypothetical protein
MLKMGMAATVLPLDASAWTVPSADTRWGEPVALYRAVYDTRFAASRAFGERMTAHGITGAAITGDMTALWLNTLYPQWQQGAAAIAGLTARGPLFCLERLSWDHGMRVVFRAQHSASSAGAIRHEIEGAALPVEAARRVATDGDWVRVVSDVIVRHPRTTAPNVSVQVQTAQPAFQVPGEEILYSWVIAPVTRSYPMSVLPDGI